ncbi:MAG TPA: hypothetical protein DCP32_15005 [Anaerolineaceae bacterium]|nr:MAG: hypothetical protein A2X24_02465 [Chloroflexi bacterium GWB2_54_36]HAL17996.1 hypothetical protein [Anaerolineaceae bacterium]HBA91420.1 hypothetical protein [Anaerolineaceae bacterium]
MTLQLEPTALILVVVVTNPRDLEIARVLGWYRIPLKSAPKVVAVDYLAFYQTAGFGEQERWRINFIASVRGHELTTRAELIRDEPDHPRAGEEYYKIQLGPLQALPHPVQADQWRRITFLYTTGELLHQAQIVKDLVVRDEERALLWQSLRERAMCSGDYGAAELPEDQFQLDPLVLAMLGGFDKIHEQFSDWDNV